jgi:hypothetical protein
LSDLILSDPRIEWSPTVPSHSSHGFQLYLFSLEWAIKYLPMRLKDGFHCARGPYFS